MKTQGSMRLIWILGAVAVILVVIAAALVILRQSSTDSAALPTVAMLVSASVTADSVTATATAAETPVPTTAPESAAELLPIGTYVHSLEEQHQLLSFFDDGLVIGVPVQSANLCGDWPTIQGWFQRESDRDGIGTGSFVSAENRIEFSLESIDGTVEYEGIFADNRLSLDSLSLINGRREMGVVYLPLPCTG
jgi:hypothetical protein